MKIISNILLGILGVCLIIYIAMTFTTIYYQLNSTDSGPIYFGFPTKSITFYWGVPVKDIPELKKD